MNQIGKAILWTVGLVAIGLLFGAMYEAVGIGKELAYEKGLAEGYEAGLGDKDKMNEIKKKLNMVDKLVEDIINQLEEAKA